MVNFANNKSDWWPVSWLMQVLSVSLLYHAGYLVVFGRSYSLR